MSEQEVPPEVAEEVPVEAAPSPVVPRTLLAWSLAAANVGMFILLELLGGSENRRTLIALGAKVGPLIDHGEYWRLLSAAFLHVGWQHLGFNCAAILTFGRLGEITYGHSRFLAIYLVSAVASTTASYVFLPGLSVGASGALFGIAGALVVFYAKNRKQVGPSGRNQFVGYLFLLAINAAFGFVQPGIDNFGHMGGLIAGAILGFFLAPRLRMERAAEGDEACLRAVASPPATWIALPAVAAAIAGIIFTIHGTRA